jgi:2-haloacid dehalogenase
MSERWVTFDCFGTLVDWNGGFAGILQPLFGARTAEVVKAYHEFERKLETEKPHRLYKNVLAEGLTLAAAKVGIKISENEVRALPQAWATMPVFADVEEMLSGLRAMSCRLAVLTNCDDDLFAQTQRNFLLPFDLVTTAEQVRDYKPSPAHFRKFAEVTGATPKDWAHVACSWFHDIGPAKTLGIPRVWLDRDLTGEDASTATARVESMVPFHHEKWSGTRQSRACILHRWAFGSLSRPFEYGQTCAIADYFGFGERL